MNKISKQLLLFFWLFTPSSGCSAWENKTVSGNRETDLV